MSVLIGLENGETAALRTALKDGEVDKTVTEFLNRAVFPQSVGWMLHTKAACVVMDVCANTIRRIKRIMATLPGVRRVFFQSHRGVKYAGLLVGDYVESDSYPVVSWVDSDGVEHDGIPPKIGTLKTTVTDSPTASPTVPAGHVGTADKRTAQESKPKTAKGWKKYEGEARTVVERTPARSVRGVALIIRWAVEDQGHDVEDIVARLVRLGDGIGVTRAALENDLSPANRPTASAASAASADVSRETPTASTANDGEISDGALRRSCEVAVALRPVKEARPELAGVCAFLEVKAEHRPVATDRPVSLVEHLSGSLESYGVSDVTEAEGYRAGEALAASGRGWAPEVMADAVKLVRAGVI